MLGSETICIAFYNVANLHLTFYLIASNVLMLSTKSSFFLNYLTHQAPVVWKLAQMQTAGPQYIRRPVHDILVLHFKCQPLCAELYVFLYKVWIFLTSLYLLETYVYNVRWRTVWSGEHFKANMVYFACSHARISPSAEIRSACCNLK